MIARRDRRHRTRIINMYYEPDTVWGRTIEGDEEVTVPRSGLSIVQRRVLRELAQPRTFAAIAAKHKMEAPKLENELIWLAERKLVAFQRPGAPARERRRASTCRIPMRRLPMPRLGNDRRSPSAWRLSCSACAACS
jgi:hypothetical protein